MGCQDRGTTGCWQATRLPEWYHPKDVYYSTRGELPQDSGARTERLTRFFHALKTT